MAAVSSSTTEAVPNTCSAAGTRPHRNDSPSQGRGRPRTPVLYSAQEAVEAVTAERSGATATPSEEPMSDEPSDLVLVDAYRGGDAAAFDCLFRRYHQRIRSLCLRYLGDAQAAEDLVQETFFNVVKSLNRVDDTYNFGAWIHRIAVNLCHDELRRRERHRQHVETGGGETEENVLRLLHHDPHRPPPAAPEITHLRPPPWGGGERPPPPPPPGPP